VDAEIKKLNQAAQQHAKKLNILLDEVGKVIVGQKDILRRLMISIIADGHVLIEGVPGLAKTLMIKTFSDAIEAKFQRIQFTPDLLPADIVGTKIYTHETSSFATRKGPIFSNFILADEINRAPPKVQSALLEAMQERQVTIQGDTFKLSSPFIVLATQNPLETEGTYKLPEAQVDRFMFKLLIDYPTKEDEKEIIKRMTTGKKFKIDKVLTPDYIAKLQEFNKEVYVDSKIEENVTDIVDATRNPADYKLDIDAHIECGASPRATIWLIMAGKANALLNGRGYVIPEDIQTVAHEVLRHRIILTYEAEAEDVTADDLIEKILHKIRVP
jgi:MoxR-like ATPase